MESQDTATLLLLKVWPALEANKNRIIGGAVAILLLIILVWFMSWERQQKEVNAGQAFSQLTVSLPPNISLAQIAGMYLKLAGDYSNTQAGQRAQLQGAADLFSAGNYADSQTQFQKFVDTYPASSLHVSAELGIAACLDAQGKTNAAVDAYKKVTETYGNLATQVTAKFALGRIYEQQGNLTDAIRCYEEVARSVSGTSLSQQASLKAVELKANLPVKPTVATPAPAAPMSLLSK